MEPVQTATIVIVEDEVAIADVLAARLRTEGFAVEVAGDGLRGVELCARVAPDLVVLEEVWGYADGSAGARTVDSHVAAVRRKLGADVLRTVQGIGYAFGSPGAPEPER